MSKPLKEKIRAKWDRLEPLPVKFFLSKMRENWIWLIFKVISEIFGEYLFLLRNSCQPPGVETLQRQKTWIALANFTRARSFTIILQPSTMKPKFNLFFTTQIFSSRNLDVLLSKKLECSETLSNIKCQSLKCEILVTKRYENLHNTFTEWQIISLESLNLNSLFSQLFSHHPVSRF